MVIQKFIKNLNQIIKKVKYKLILNKNFSLLSVSVAAPIARTILNDAINALDIKKRVGGINKEYRYFDTKYITVPDVVGNTIKEARTKLKGFSIEYSGSGDKVISMSPKAGSSVPLNSIIRLMLG